MHALSGVEMPKRRARLRVHGLEGLCIIAEKKQAAGSGHNAPGRMSRTCLNISPRRFVGFKTVGQQNFLAMITGAVTNARGIIGLSFGKFLWLQKIQIAVFVCQKIKKASGGIVRRRVPVSCANQAGTYARAPRGGLHARSNRPALRI